MSGRFWRALAIGAALSVAAACGGADSPELGEVGEALQRTETAARRFVHEVRTGGVFTVVDVVVEDEGRYRARMTFDGRPVYEEVALDDALAVRVLDEEVLKRLLVTPDATGPAVDALRNGAWVIDSAGAIDMLLSVSEEERGRAYDPVLEALTFLDHVGTIAGTQGFVAFNPDALDYDPKEDPFPKPREGSDVDRWDARLLGLPDANAIAGVGRGRTLPEAEHFRKMSVYIREGRVVEVREDVRTENRPRQLAGLLEALDVPDVPDEDRPQRVLAELNKRHRAAGSDPIAEATAVFKVTELTEAPRIALPEDGVKASLSVLRHRGRGSSTPNDGRAGAGSGTASTTAP